jgi:hypothetical protein
LAQPPVIIGLISNFIGSPLQDDIATTLLAMQQSGQDILCLQSKTKGGKSDCKNACFENRIRKVPKSFSWLDHRLVQHRYIESLSHSQAALYLFLVCVADDKGLSYYGDPALMKKLGMDQACLNEARSGLIQE